jgi:hypothetical protein
MKYIISKEKRNGKDIASGEKRDKRKGGPKMLGNENEGRKAQGG